MPHSSLDPVFLGLRFGLHALLIGLAGFAVVRAFALESPMALWALVIGLTFITVYLFGAWRARTGRSQRVSQHRLALTWIALLTVLWALLTWLSPEGAFIVFPLFFLYLHLLPGAGGIAAIAVSTAFSIVALVLHHGFSVGGVIGPCIGACVAVLIGLAYRALEREALKRERIMSELVSTRQQLANTEREQGALTERARLAREIHDTVAQGLSSIQMLLNAAERDTHEPGAGYLRLARETAADSLADTRQIIRELTPARLGDGLPAALRRLGHEQSARAAIPITVTADDIDLPMGSQIALLRIAQGALANSIRHANASHIEVELRQGEQVELHIRDDGRGFDLSTAVVDAHPGDAFGLDAMRERVEQLDGTLTIDTSRGGGTNVTARLPIASAFEVES